MTTKPSLTELSTLAEPAIRDAIGETRLAELVQAMLDVAVPPIFLSHDMSDQLAQPLDDSLAALRSWLRDNRDDEQIALLEANLPLHLEGEPLELALLELATHNPYFALPDALYDSIPEPHRVFQHLPDLAELLDDDGLVAVDTLDANSHCLYVAEWAVHYHQFLRRSFSSNVNDTLLRVLISAAERSGSTLRLGIDHRRLCRRENFLPFIEEDYWYGPHLTDEWLDDPHEVGRTVHRDPNGDDSSRDFKALFAYWQMGNPPEKIVQMEELPIAAMAIDGRFLCRYLHSIRDIDRHVFVHVDGAVRMYDDQNFQERAEEQMPTAARANRYRKVFRIDGEVSTEEWSDIVAKWFRHNELAGEYLSGLGQGDAE